MRKVLLIFLVFTLLVLAFLGYDVYRKVYIPFNRGDPSIIISIDHGETLNEIADNLEKSGIIASSRYFKIYFRIFFSSENVKAGEYLFDSPLSMRQVIEKLVAGRVIIYRVTIKEGMTIQEIAEFLNGLSLLDREAMLSASKNIRLISDLDDQASDLEGYMFPDTYVIQKNTTAEEMVAMMVRRFRQNFSISMNWRARDINFSIRSLVTLASLIEKETAFRDERFLISSVFHNRLKQNMLLDCDPTIIYALKKANRYQGKLGWDELKYDSPYNTRRHRGLPPGPICNPGASSLEAALYPENTKYLFFVAKDSQSHHFSETLQEHNRAVKEYIIEKKDLPVH